MGRGRRVDLPSRPRPAPGRDDLATVAALVHGHEASIRAVTSDEKNRFSDCLAALRELAAALDDPIAIVGGFAAIHHGAAVTTLDIDICVSRGRLAAILEAAPRHGLRVRTESPHGWHALVFAHPDGDLEVHVIPEGEKSPRDPIHAPPNPGPRDLGVATGLGFAEFASWAAMKLVAGRDKDHYHLVEVLQRRSEGDIATLVEKLRPLDPSYLATLERLLRAAEDERGQESW